MALAPPAALWFVILGVRLGALVGGAMAVRIAREMSSRRR